MSKAPGLDKHERATAIARIAVGAVLAVGCIVSLSFNLPGHLTYDSIMQLLQGRTGRYNNWHPPVMAWMLGVGDAAVPGTALFVIFDTLLLYTALLSFLLLPTRPTWRTVLLAAALVASPQMLIYPGIVWKDVLFAAAALTGFTTLAHAAARWQRPRTRIALLVLAFLALALGALARQNGAVIVVLGAISAGIIAAGAEGTSRFRRGIVYSSTCCCGAVLFVAIAMFALNLRGDGVRTTEAHLKSLRLYDLAAALAAQPAFELEYLRAASPNLEQLLRTEGAAAYTPKSVEPITGRNDIGQALTNTPAQALGAEWQRLIVHSPGLYLSARAAAFAQLLLTSDSVVCRPFSVGINGPGDWLAQLGIATRMDPRDRMLERYGQFLTPTPVFSHALYAVISVVMLIVLARRRHPADVAIAAMLASALVYTITFFVISVSCDYRYIYYLDVAAMAGALYLAMGISGQAQQSH